ncbi:hypothetical protein A6F65_00697 [Paraurantiacibacter namhicola]|uniref:SnoaL-like domain-containing protein n=1 Tax=Paraurantiacibacter namhicola TaxID=645517 RepID=A0A1C7D6C4_9SPHN|nr:hypothetical protein A6F65_00697 [Paraurantiacibacter namhicola]
MAVAAMAMALSACGGNDAPEQPQDGAELAGQGLSGPTIADFPVLQSDDCADVAQFYFDAIAAREFDRAALVWDDPVVDDARLGALFAGYTQPKFTVSDIRRDEAGPSESCTITGALADLADPARVLREGTVILQRAAGDQASTPDQQRWRVQSSDFIEEMQRAGRGGPA